MPHGAPDFYRYRRDSVTYPLEDLAELAVRLGTPHSFDRRGDIIWFDDFSGQFPGWTRTALGPAAGIAISPEWALTGGYSIGLTSSTTAGLATYILRRLAYPVLSRIGLEVAFTLNPDHDYLEFDLALFDGVNRDYTSVILDYVNTRLRYLDVAGNPQTIVDGLNLSTDPGHFHIIKMVVDFVNNWYVRVIFNNVSYDLTGTLYNIAGWAPSPHLRVTIGAYSQAATNPTTYIDRVIVTQDEP